MLTLLKIQGGYTMSNKPTHDILLAENFETADEQQKSYFTNVGSAWMKDSGTISCQIREGLAVSGRLVIMPKREKQSEDVSNSE